MRNITLFISLLLCAPVHADIVVSNRNLRAGDVFKIQDLRVIEGQNTGGFDQVADVVGQEARTALYPNRPILVTQVGPPALIERNQVVQVRFAGSGLSISTEGRALERGGLGDRIRFMNLTSRATLFGVVQSDGQIAVFQ
jgi:flagella basal body P-ring formation protein FlgA